MATTSILTNKGASIIDKAITDEAKCVISRVVTSTHYENLPTELAAKSPFWWDGAEGTVTGLSLVNASLDVKVHWNARLDAQPVKSIGLMVKRAGADKDYLLYAESYSNTAVTLERALDRIFSLPINIPAATFDAIGNTMNAELNEEIEEIGGDMSGLGASLAYDGENTLIQLKNSEGEVLSSIDASDFVIDGMVDSVAVVDGYLVITFNTASGKSDIRIPVTDFFDASQYYTKTETDTQISSAITALNLGAASQKAVDSSITAQSDANLPTSSAVKGYVGDEITALNLGAASQKAVDTSIGVSSDANLPTSGAVKSYVSSQLPTVNNASVTIKKNASDTTNPFSFTLNQSSDAELNIGLADGAFKSVDTAIDAQSDANLPTSGAVKTYVSSQLPTVNNNTITIKKNSSDTTNPFSFTLNQNSNAELNIGLGGAAVKDVDTSIGSSSSSNLPTTDAVKAYVAENSGVTLEFNNEDRILFLKDRNSVVLSTCRIPEKADVYEGLVLTATADNSSVKLIKNGTLNNTFEVNTGSGWSAYTFGTVINLNSGDICKWRCSAHPTTQDDWNYVSFVLTGTIEAYGNINSMLSSNFQSITSLAEYSSAFTQLFTGQSALTKAPFLPATTLSNGCYTSMFQGSGITQAPVLPATTLANSCYDSMFMNCTSLMQAPALPATTVFASCYKSMFRGCSALTQAPVLPATEMQSQCYASMLRGTAITQAPALPATTLAANCYDSMFWDCTSLTQAPVLPATTVAMRAYKSMFQNCTSLTTPPALPATTIDAYAYAQMFQGCTSLNEVCIAATTTASNALDNWLLNVAPTGDFYCDPSATIFPADSASGIPSGWTRRDIALTEALTLTATANNSSVQLTKIGTLDNTFEVDTGSGWQSYTFGTVINLNAGQSCKWRCSAHPTTQSVSNNVKFVMTGTIEASGNVNSMLSSDFENITSLSGYNYAFVNLFYGCTALTQAPVLPAASLADFSYQQMFYNCTSLTEVHIAATNISATNCLRDWLSGVSSTGDFYCDPNTIYPSGVSGKPASWSQWLYGARNTGTTTTMYHNGSAETVRVGTSSYGTCYSAQGWAGFKTLAQMHALGYTFGAQTSLTMYHGSDPVSAYSCDANVNDSFTETMYDVGDGNGYLTIAQQNANGYTLPAPAPVVAEPLTLTATANNSSVTLNKVGTLDNTFEVNTGSEWGAYTFGTAINLNAGQSCKWRCSSHPTTQDGKNHIQFVMTGTIEASGNVNSMLSSDFGNITSLSGYNNAFNSLFNGCTSLTQSPELPATTLASNCYENLFRGCTSLTQAPNLPATTLVQLCYNSMFQDCTALTQAPELPATTLAGSCYRDMFNNCASITQAPVLPATTLGKSCYSNMFNNCASLTQAPALPAATLVQYCYSGMFNGCPLSEVRIAATDISATGCLSSWLAKAPATGDFYCDPNTNFPTNSASGIPSGWTRHALADYPVTP